MNKAWNCTLVKRNQTGEECSFIGGKPKLPAGFQMPECTLCGHEMIFMFQVAFPEGHVWSGKTLALFFCISCSGGYYCIPEMPKVLKGVDIPEGFLDNYQRNFRVVVFNTEDGILQNDYKEKVAFQAIEMQMSNKVDKNAEFTLGGKPVWIMRKDETPASYAGTQKLKLLLQIKEDYKFEKLDDAPPQANKFLPNGVSKFPWYNLFVRNHIYFWGTEGIEDPKVYISVQKF